MGLSNVNHLNFSQPNNFLVTSDISNTVSRSNTDDLILSSSLAIVTSHTKVDITVSASKNVSSNVERHDEIQTWEKVITYVMLIMLFVIFVTGFIGNGALVLIFIAQRRHLMRNASNIYISSLAVGDLLLILFGLPFAATIYLYNTWTFGTWICKMMECVKDISLGVSVFTLTALSIDRYFAIVNPLKKFYSSFGKKKEGIIVTAFIWTISFLFATPAAINSYVRVFNGTDYLEVCYPYTDEWISNYPQIVVISKFFVYYAIPLIIIALFYALMASHLCQSLKTLPRGSQLRKIRNDRKKVAITVFVFVSLFAICFLPQQIFMLWFYLNPNSERDFNSFWYAFRMLGIFLSFFNSCINPIALYFVSESFRKKFKSLFRSCFFHKMEESSGTKKNRCKYHSYRLTQIHGESNISSSIQMSILRKQTKLDFQSSNNDTNVVLLHF